MRTRPSAPRARRTARPRPRVPAAGRLSLLEGGRSVRLRFFLLAFLPALPLFLVPSIQRPPARGDPFVRLVAAGDLVVIRVDDVLAAHSLNLKKAPTPPTPSSSDASW